MSALFSLPSLSSVSALSCLIGASGFGCRPSSRGLGGFVAVVGFRRRSLASVAAGRFASLLPACCGGCVVRFCSRSGLFVVSVPVLPASVPAVVRRGSSLWFVGAPPALRSSFMSGGVWSVWPAPFSSPAPVWPSGWSGRSSAPAAPVRLVGFSGSRSLSGSFRGLVSGLVGSVSRAGLGVAVGCCSGLDSLVRSVCPSAVVFSADSWSPAALVSRSVACVQAVASSGGSWVSFPGSSCPPSVRPSAVASRCFSGSGSGSWASAALAAGLGLPVVVFGLSRDQLPGSWGSWVPAGSGPWSRGFRLVPPAQQLSLF